MSNMTRRDLLGLLSAVLATQALGGVPALAGPTTSAALWESVARDLLPDVATSGHWMFDTEGGLSAAASGFKYLWETQELEMTTLQSEARARIGDLIRRHQAA